MIVDRIDLDRHAVVEASAGTGKTYTIERLVLRLLVERDVPLENILVVTFTEKATGELKERIRQSIESAVAQGPPNARLAASLDDFDQAPIFTIHGFCQRLLQEYSLEKGQDFRPELVDDVERTSVALQEVQRRVWPNLFGKHLARVLTLGGFDREKAEKFNEKATTLAQRYRPECGHRVLPPLVPDWFRHVAAAKGEGDELLAELQHLDRTIAWEAMLLLQTVEETRRLLAETKRQRGQQSFDDMIARVDEGLDPSRNPNAPDLLHRLRLRFRYGIVDEFQDTDPLQWRIFRRLFLEAGASKLIVVGDPKQAIYGFRGADLPTYQEAVRDMETRHGARSYPLAVNWRSVPELLTGLNHLFVEGAFFERKDEIGYVPVQAPPAEERRLAVPRDDTRRCALTILDLDGHATAAKARTTFAHFVAAEIGRLLVGAGGGPALAYSLKGGEPKDLDAGDICILVHRRAENRPIVEALTRARIPYSFYKQVGLWDSDEAHHVRMLLEALQKPDEPASLRKALLTRFFRLTPGQIARCGEVPSHHPARRLFLEWAAFADERRWSALFQSLLERSGVMLAGRDEPDFERRQANYRTLFSMLEQCAYRDNADLLHLIAFIRSRGAATAESDYQPMETERAKVKIMTVHSSKGLEFPVVFYAGGFTANRPDLIRSYRDPQKRLVFDLRDETPENKFFPWNELQAQNRRLMYVGLTRAMIKLYVPMLATRMGIKKSPITHVLNEPLRRARMDKLTAEVEVVKPQGNDRVEPLPEDLESKLNPRPPLVVDELFPTFEGDLRQRRIVMQSFTSLHRIRQAAQAAAFGDGVDRRDESEPQLGGRDDPFRGAAFGDVVHQALEAVDFAEIGRLRDADDLLRVGSPTRSSLDAIVHANLHKFSAPMPVDQLEEACRMRVAQLVWNALRTPLSAIGGPLCDVSPEDRLTELEFNIPERPGSEQGQPLETFVTGYMDLVFRRRAKVFLLDWKTNLLPAYGPDELALSMDKADYHRQYRLYLVALVRWLERIYGKRFDYDRMIGGVCYLYVRGMNGRDDSAGVYFRKPDRKELDLPELLR